MYPSKPRRRSGIRLTAYAEYNLKLDARQWAQAVEQWRKADSSYTRTP